jgi:N-acetylglucosamine-6-phosphate deacetylase
MGVRMNIRGRIVGTKGPTTVTVEGGTISKIGNGSGDGQVLGDEGVWISPAMCDVQVNGAGGISYSAPDLTVDQVLESQGWFYRGGTGLFCPTVITSPAEQMTRALGVLAKACEESETTAASIVGFHVEGPYVSPDDGPRGVHLPEHMRNPDWDDFQRYQEAAGGRIRILTLAPEREGALPFIERAAESGVIVAIGHSGASRRRIREAIAAGARLSTHLGNGSHGFLPVHDNYMWEQLAADELWASIIPDGHHMPPPALKTACRMKGRERVCLVSDVSPIGGLPPGVYDPGPTGEPVEVHPDGRTTLEGTTQLAGAALFLDRGVPNAVACTDAGLPEAVEMVARNPARMLGTDDRVGSVEAGKEATLTLFRWEEGAEALSIVATLVKGEVVYRE